MSTFLTTVILKTFADLCWCHESYVAGLIYLALNHIFFIQYLIVLISLQKLQLQFRDVGLKPDGKYLTSNVLVLLEKSRRTKRFEINNWLEIKSKPSHDEYEFALCLGSKAKSSGTFPSSISLILIQSAQLVESISVSRSLLPHCRNWLMKLC